MQTKNTFNMHISHYSRVLSELINDGATFQLINDGSTSIISMYGKTWKFIDYTGLSGNGYHLSKMVFKDATNFMLNDPRAKLLKKKREGALIDNIDLEVQKANMDALVRHQGQDIFNVDVNDCYWDTAHHLGFITQETYLKGLQKKEWKVGRNASIGALSKVITVVDYVDGIKSQPRREVPEVDLSPIRDAIVYHVHNAFLDIMSKLDNDWLIYFTDCLYVPFSKVKTVQEYFQNIGYQTKISEYHLDSVDVKTGLTVWHDYKNNKAKWFQFSQRQQTLKQFQFVPKMENNTEFLSEKNDEKNEENLLNCNTKKHTKKAVKRPKK